MKSRFLLINAGLFPEVLPPCFNSSDAQRAFRGLVGKLDDQKFHERKTEFTRYNGTKHDGSRRFFGTPNIITYFHISSFIWRRWKNFEKNFGLSTFSIGTPKIMGNGEERAVKVPSLSELSKHTSENISFAPFILKADISQCFHSIYTHSIPWAAHGVNESKANTEPDSDTNYFNALDLFVRNSQRGHTRGVLVGPDAYRLIAEFILAKIDKDLSEIVGDKIVGAARHVDDYYFGLRSEHDAHSVLSNLRDVLSNYELNLNDHKTRIYSSLEPINDLWAQRLRDHMPKYSYYLDFESVERAVSEAVDASRITNSDSPIKILFRHFDKLKIYESGIWDYFEQNMQRIVQKHPHSIDYACLLVAKRHALEKPINRAGWQSVAEMIIKTGLLLNHDHEVIWMVWLLLVCEIGLTPDLIDALQKNRNGHLRALLIAAFTQGKITRKPKLSLGQGLSSVDSGWLTNLVARSEGFSGASFSGLYADEFSHLSSRHIKLIDMDGHAKKVRELNTSAISRIRYGYDNDGHENADDPW